MKRFLLQFTSIALLIACTNASSKEFNAAVKKVTESTYSASGKLGEIVIEKQIEHTTTEYNSDGEKIKYESFNKDDYAYSWTEKYKYKYNSDGKLAEQDNYNEDGELVGATKYEYNSTGKLTKKEYSDPWNSNTYEYDTDGKNVIREKYIREGGDMGEIEYEYNIDGQLIKIAHHYEDEGGMPSGRKTVSEYKYPKLDDEKNWIERIEFIDGEVSGITKREITYYE